MKIMLSSPNLHHLLIVMANAKMTVILRLISRFASMKIEFANAILMWFYLIGESGMLVLQRYGWLRAR